MILAATKDAAGTQQLAAAIAELARPGDVVVLCGDLGAGKTAFAQGFGRELGVDGPVTSPTFMLVSRHDGGRLVMHHLDVYRLEQPAEVVDLGLVELLDEGGVTLIEWGDRILSALPADYLEVRLTLGKGDDDRVVAIETVGPRWSARERALGTALAPWALPDPRAADDPGAAGDVEAGEP